MDHPSARPAVEPDAVFAESLQFSFLAAAGEGWITSPQLSRNGLTFSPKNFLHVVDFLLANPNFHASTVFRADILYDSSGSLKTPEDKERDFTDRGYQIHEPTGHGNGSVISLEKGLPARWITGFVLKRMVVRNFIPKNRKLDRELKQTCHFYSSMSEAHGQHDASHDCGPLKHSTIERYLVIYTPHASSQADLPFYHPKIRALALLYESKRTPQKERAPDELAGKVSLHFLPFSDRIPEIIPFRLQRTLLSILSTHIRLSQKEPPMCSTTGEGARSSLKDNLILQHVVQNTYVRLKETHAQLLCQNWVESTEPSKHVFEDIAIAAFLIELWKLIYDSTDNCAPKDHEGLRCKKLHFPGFVDLACGNGVLVYILLAEGYEGWGFDARRRKTWRTFPASTQDHLKELVCVPKPFADALENSAHSAGGQLWADVNAPGGEFGSKIHSGIFKNGAFLISNHADELTVWTPLLGALSNPDCPLPFLAIPCCSHAISGARYRYPAPRRPHGKSLTGGGNRGGNTEATRIHHTSVEVKGLEQTETEQDAQPTSGDFKALRAYKQAAQADPFRHSTSAYGALTAKTIDIAAEVGYDVKHTLLRIPSTRNIGIVGLCNKPQASVWKRQGAKLNVDIDQACEVEPSEADHVGSSPNALGSAQTLKNVQAIIDQECASVGGVLEAANTWTERALGLQKSQGRGRLKKLQETVKF